MMLESSTMRIRSIRDETFASIPTMSVTPYLAAPRRQPFQQSSLELVGHKLGHRQRKNMAVQQKNATNHAALHLSGEPVENRRSPLHAVVLRKTSVSSHVAEIVPRKILGQAKVELQKYDFFNRLFFLTANRALERRRGELRQGLGSFSAFARRPNRQAAKPLNMLEYLASRLLHDSSNRKSI
ncbi:hypothetical protein PZN02_004370 [Sinorhizobium garamanticum]|uniref:Uncharacterized protein n=1 Tax=Sinorhizobium garamanticum TaxID=680247 RepID=A0ABY8DMD2_9HYPH|nr:hypothetical protein [Sinorhizobium garamanticum]WEX91373.1 hypothetical protein PZN02_004370 [Sinorhizobium garamanticum]